MKLKEDNHWYEVDDKVALDKTKNALRAKKGTNNQAVTQHYNAQHYNAGFHDALRKMQAGDNNNLQRVQAENNDGLGRMCGQETATPSRFPVLPMAVYPSQHLQQQGNKTNMGGGLHNGAINYMMPGATDVDTTIGDMEAAVAPPGLGPDMSADSVVSFGDYIFGGTMTEDQIAVLNTKITEVETTIKGLDQIKGSYKTALDQLKKIRCNARSNLQQY